MIKNAFITALLIYSLICSLIGYVQENSENVIQKPKLFVAYVLEQAAFNKVQSLSDEI